MLYAIELSVKNNTNIKSTINEIANAATDLSCYDYSITYEYEKYKKTGKNKVIYLITVKFAEDNMSHCLQFIQMAKRNRNICVESIYNNKLLYASSYYKKLSNTSAPINNTYNEIEKQILQIMS